MLPKLVLVSALFSAGFLLAVLSVRRHWRLSGALMTKVFLFHRDEHNDILAVADWGQKLSFYQLSGKQVNNKNKKIVCN